METENPSKRSFGVPITIVALGALVAGAFLLHRDQARSFSPVSSPAPTAVAVVPSVEVSDNDPMVGEANAPVTIFLFTQFHCPFCRHFFSATFPQLKERLIDTGQVRLVFKPFPIGDDEKSPELAERVALAALCADEQDSFISYLSHISVVGAGDDEDDLEGYAASDGLDVAAFMACLRSRAYAEVVATNIREAVAYGITSTPTFVINNELFEGALSYAELERLASQL